LEELAFSQAAFPGSSKSLAVSANVLIAASASEAVKVWPLERWMFDLVYLKRFERLWKHWRREGSMRSKRRGFDGTVDCD
jgi:hypothetical protein